MSNKSIILTETELKTIIKDTVNETLNSYQKNLMNDFRQIFHPASFDNPLTYLMSAGSIRTARSMPFSFIVWNTFSQPLTALLSFLDLILCSVLMNAVLYSCILSHFLLRCNAQFITILICFFMHYVFSAFYHLSSFVSHLTLFRNIYTRIIPVSWFPSTLLLYQFSFCFLYIFNS